MSTLKLKGKLSEAETAIRSEVLALDAKETKLEAAKEAVEAKLTAVTFTRDELLAMLRSLPAEITDPTMDLPIAPTDPAELAYKASLPPIDERKTAPVQLPAAALGSFSINGIPVFAPQVDVNPATGRAYVQAGPRPTSLISPPPSRNFK